MVVKIKFKHVITLLMEHKDARYETEDCMFESLKHLGVFFRYNGSSFGQVGVQSFLSWAHPSQLQSVVMWLAHPRCASTAI